ncbi:MAG: ABC transporter permease [Clostridiales Family XIII bacterium]|jgi:ribose transport system permease protein|nr:ABC transporter permease [Clostridiales Family XIII bacterium]
MSAPETKALENYGDKKKFNLQKLLTGAALIILIVFFMTYGYASRGLNLVLFSTNILESAYYIGFLAIGVTFVIITGGIDLSLGTVMMCGALVGGTAFTAWGLPMWLSLVLVVVTTTLFGLLNGFLIAYLKLPAFIATMGSMMIAQGFGSTIAKVQTQRYPTATETGGWFKQVFLKTSEGFPVGVIWLIVLFALAVFLLNKTKFGKYTFAIGSNIEAARLSGIKTERWLTLIYTVSGIFVGFAGILYSATFTTIMPMGGAGLELQGIAAVVIGGTSLSGGVGTLSGTMIGVFIMATLKAGLMAIGIPQQLQTLLVGVVVVLAVLLDIQRQKTANKVRL